MKRLMSLLLMLCLLIPCLAAPALADTPKPIPTIDYDSIPEPREGLHHYLLLCSDQWTNKLVNTDGIVIVTLDTVTHRIMLTSIIRDALVERPDGVIGRINYIARNSGPEALCKVISQHLGIKIEKYILLNFQMIANIIDYLGGVDITVNASEAAYLRRYPLDPGQTEPTMAQAGTYCFTGRAAVIYMRIRKAGGGGDFMRTQRARTVMSTLADQCRTFTYDQARDLVDVIMKNNLQTNMTLDDMIAAMEQALKLRTCVIEELRIPQNDAVHPISYAGMAVQEVDWVMSREDMANFLSSGWLVIDDNDEDEEVTVSEKDQTYMEEKYHHVTEHIPEIDEMLNRTSEGWKTTRMGKVDLAILRLAVYEMKFDEDVPVGVAINEAVELAKRFGRDQSPSFINGILGKLAREEDEK